MKSSVVFILLLLLTHSVAAHSSTVQVEGVSAVIAGDLARARDEALRDAYRRAVETVGVRIDSETAIENLQLLYDRVLAQASGYVQSYTIVSDGVRDDGLYSVWIDAVVVSGSLREQEDGAGLSVLLDLMDRPRLAVLIEPIAYEGVPSHVVESGLVRRLIGLGYRVVDTAQVERVRDSDQAMQAFAGNMEAAMAIGQRVGADIILTGRVGVTFGNPMTTGQFTFHSATAEGSIQALATRTGQILYSWVETTTKADTRREKAIQQAMAELGTDLGSQIAWELPRYLGGEAGGRMLVEVLVMGLESYTEARRLQSMILEMRSVTSVQIEEFQAGIGMYSVETTGTADDLAIRLEDLEIPLVLSRFSRDRLEVEKRQ